MLVPYEELTSEAKVLIYPGSRKLFPVELPEIEQELRKFCQELDGIDLCFKLEYNRFIVFIISEETPLNLDQHNLLVGFVQELEKVFDLVLLDKVNVCFKQGQYVQMKEIPDFKGLIKNKGVSKKTIVFDHMINTKYEFEDSWEIPAGESWLATGFQATRAAATSPKLGDYRIVHFAAHAAIDTEISCNHIYRTCRGIWLDWMAQGARVTRNLLHDNNTSEDLFMEVNHGPYLIDNNIFLSGRSLFDMSQGGAYVHNLFAGRIRLRPELRRETPFHKAHSTEVAGLLNIKGGDDRFYNNIFVAGGTETLKPNETTQFGLATYNKAARPVYVDGNVYLNGAAPYANEDNYVRQESSDPDIHIVEKDKSVHLHIMLDQSWRALNNSLVTTKLLGLAAVPEVSFENSDGTPLIVDIDYFGRKRDTAAPSPGPFENPGEGKLALKVW